jgi:tRNA dimethylallyltransferase
VPPRDTLYAAVDARFQRMVERGALEEVSALLALGLDPELPAMKAVGVRELAAVLKGEVELPRAIEAARRQTRHYAKRQFTWLRHQLVGSRVINAQYSESNQHEMFSFIRHFVLTTQS